MTLTELEGATLGLLWSCGSATAYELRQMIADSPTPHWSASAGTVYPLVAKLCRSRLVSFSSTGDGRSTKRLRITRPGMQAFKKWMLDCSPAVVGPPPDPMRTRVRFLELLSASEEAGLLLAFERALRSQLSQARGHARRRGSAEGHDTSHGELLVRLGARLVQERRVEWIKAAKAQARRQRSARKRRSP